MYRSALTRYFKDERSIDIIRNEKFLKYNEMFVAVAKVNKELGLGNIESYPPINDADHKKLSQYFKIKMHANPDPKYLQHVVVFFIIYYLC